MKLVLTNQHAEAATTQTQKMSQAKRPRIADGIRRARKPSRTASVFMATIR